MRLLRSGTTHDDVKILQWALSAHGFDLDADGIFGAATKTVVRQFQASSGLDADGVVGPATWSSVLSGPGAKYRPGNDKHSGSAVVLVDPSLTLQVRSVLEAAIKDIGAREYPDGSNRGPAIDHLVKGYGPHWGIQGRDAFPWCAIAVSSWIGIGMGIGTQGSNVAWRAHPFGHWYGGVAQIEEWARSRRVLYDASQLRAGDVFTMARSGSGSDPSRSTRAGHTGLVIRRDGSKVITVEGNASNKVTTRTRSVSSLSHAVRWYGPGENA